ncbi:bifunctional hydroxymethylpyrimidine kinase/phosphomethylpyrimidine kinase [Leptolyngbya sp. 7M]|uniref:bifunctional hydroxymethylpyrimidine kinase/phosphomethylpyrimidine kinase n=1 Tax=Leptolyngbya sp. 7M TaxID=2812896 RepID=UPI001B8D93D9|nr:bifunctional hydroxymethylpyrimidine kinase/phosphomethylpyrimidine kinase [Leptolyngbya sp. 7M]QYO65274.1 bifunctional hydroxymethylpyrimidine kinase/phosphomethylpyrimidine kinase [Leptolyngbya sp. 7M]
MTERSKPPVCMSIAGVDPSGGAGIYADIATFVAFGCYPTAVISSITFQNTTNVFGAEALSATSVRDQAEPVFEDLPVAAVKTGMLPTKEVIEEVASILAENQIKRLVVDPVVRSTSGFDLIDNAALRSLVERLFPCALIVTPNVPETERITGVAIEDCEDVIRAAEVMRGFGVSNVLIKGGHLKYAGKENEMATDFLFIEDEMTKIEAPFIHTSATHGTGCVLAAAITAGLALGNELENAVKTAKSFVNEGIRTAPMLGKGNSPINIRPISQ